MKDHKKGSTKDKKTRSALTASEAESLRKAVEKGREEARKEPPVQDEFKEI